MRIMLTSLAGILLSTTCVNAQISLTSASYSDFFTTPSTTFTGSFSATIGVQTAIGNTGWSGTKIGGNGVSATSVTTSDGSANSGGLYSFGPAADNDRSLGAIASGTNIMAFGFKLINNTGLVVQDLTISFVQENWRSSTQVVNTIAASYAINNDATDSTFLSSGTFTAANSLSLVGPAPVSTNGPLNGNDPINQATRTLTLSNINLGVNEYIYFRWTDVNETGNDAGLAIDNFQVSAVLTPVPEPTSMIALAAAGLGVVTLRRRRIA